MQIPTSERPLHAVWPEGQPVRATFHASWISAYLRVMRLQLGYLLRIRDARRVRLASGADDTPVPLDAEGYIERLGGIPPRDGWPRREAPLTGPSTDLHIRTFSVV